MSPGGSRSFLFLRYLDFLRSRSSWLEQDSYFRHCVQADYFSPVCDLDLRWISSKTFRVLLAELEIVKRTDSFEGFSLELSGCSPADFIEMAQEASEKIKLALERREEVFCRLSKTEQIIAAARTVFFRALWREVLLPAYDSVFPGGKGSNAFSVGSIRYERELEELQAKGRLTMRKEGYGWLKKNGFKVEVFDELF